MEAALQKGTPCYCFRVNIGDRRRWRSGLVGLLTVLTFLPVAASVMASPPPKSCCRGACACPLKRARGSMPCHMASRSGELRPQPHFCCPREEPTADLGAAVVIPALLPTTPRAERLEECRKLTVSVLCSPQDSLHPPPLPPPRSFA